MNHVKTALLMGLLTGIALGLGYLIAGTNGMIVALVIAFFMNFIGYWFSDKIVLAMYRGRQVGPNEAPELHAMVADLARRAAVPMPKLYIIPDQTPNAFATGRNPSHAAVAVTEGLLRLLEPQEIKAVLAHEMGHVLNRDILIGTIAATFAGAVSILMWMMLLGGRGNNQNPLVMLAAIILAPIAAALIQMAISRSREYLADETSARLMGDPRPLASALAKLHQGVAMIPPQREPDPATAHMFIVSPLSGKRGGMGALFSTHPPMEKRIERLMALRL
jgi:heat shock protein HtpX